MDYKKIALAVRERPAGEAIDLGFAMAQRWWPQMGIGSLVIAALSAGAALLLFEGSDYGFGILLLWWIKPLVERPALYVASRLLVGDLQTGLGSPGEILRFIFRRLIPDLLLRRLQPWRTFMTPTRQLEGLSGSTLRLRQQVIGRKGRGTASLLSLVCFIFETGLWLGIWTLGHIMTSAVPIAQAISTTFDDPSMFSSVWGLVSYAIALGLVAPFHAGAGFTLYVNRRVHLEGWDLELVFRGLADRLGRPAAIVGILALLLTTLAPGGAPAQAAPRQVSSAPTREAVERVESVASDVYQEEPLKRWKTVTVRRLRPKNLRTRERRVRQPNLPQIGAPLRALNAIPWVVVGAMILALLWVAYGAVRKRRTGATGQSPTTEGVTEQAVTLGGDLDKNWPAAVAASIRDGLLEPALSMLYRGGLDLAQDRAGLSLPDSATEGECLRLARRSLTQSNHRDLRNYLEQTTRLWLQSAYGSVMPAIEDVQTLHAAAVQLISEVGDE